jgi:hypothetical protein
VSEEVFLGRLQTVKAFIAELQPISKIVDGRWVEIEDKLSRFPKKGLVRLDPKQLGNIKTLQSLWVFNCISRADGPHSFQADRIERARPVVDLSALSIEEAQRVLLEQGVTLPDKQTRSAVVLLSENTCCEGRFEPKDTNSQKWLLKLPSDGCVDIRDANPSWRSSYQIKEGLVYPAFGAINGSVRMRVDWSSDGDFLERFIESYGRAVRAYFSQLENSSDAAIKRFEKLLTNSGLGLQGGSDYEAIAQRLRRDWPRISNDLSGLEKLSDLLFESGPGQALLAEVIRDRSIKYETEIETSLRLQIEIDLQGVRKELDVQRAAVAKGLLDLKGLEQKVSDLETRRADLNEKIRETEQTLAQIEESVRQTEVSRQDLLDETKRTSQQKLVVEEELLVIVQSLEQARAAIREFVVGARDALEGSVLDEWGASQALARRLESLLEPANGRTSMLPLVPNPWSLDAMRNSKRLQGAELKHKLKSEAESHGIEVDDLILLDGLARAGELLLINGANAEFALRAYTRVVSAGQIYVSALDPSVIGLDDLWRSPVSNRPTPFALAWNRALTDPDVTVVVCLRSFDSAPIRLWVDAFVASLRSPRRPKNLLVLATTSGRRANDAGEPQDDLLQRSLIAIAPRASSHAAVTEVVFGEPKALPSLLCQPVENETGLTQEEFRELTSSARSANDAKRVLAIRDALHWAAGSRAKDWSAALANFWSAGGTGSLPEPLAQGYEALSALPIQP